MNPAPGLLVIGVVKARTRRFIEKDQRRIEIVTYMIHDSLGNRFYVDHFNPPQYNELEDKVYYPVYVKPFKKRDGSLSYTLCLRSDSHTRGEAF